MANPEGLTGVEFDDELLVSDRVDLFTHWDAIDHAAHLVAINGHPVGSRRALGHFKETTDELLAALAGAARGDDVTGLALVAGDVHHLAVHSDVTMAGELTRGKTGVGEAHTMRPY